VDWTTNHLAELLSRIWQALGQGQAKLQHPFRTPVLGTVGTRQSSLRIVVLRQVNPDQRSLVCYSDYRTVKVTDILANPGIEWVFYHPAERIQIRASGIATVHYLDAISKEAWNALPATIRLNYCATLAPGREIPKPTARLPKAWKGRMPAKDEMEIGWPNFAVIASTIDRLDWLQLGERENRRAGFVWDGTQFNGAWLVP
jgi:pyridoxine/pyridoxamine 5'-phosphate oxidase